MSDLYSVYEIRCLQNNRVYIGQTNDIKTRFADHKYHLGVGDHDNMYLQADYNIYGGCNFTYKVLEECNTRSSAKELEDFYIDDNGGIESDNVYNQQNNKMHNTNYNNKIRKSAENNPNFGNRGKKLSSETKYKLSVIKVQQWRDGVYDGVSEKLRGRCLTVEQKQMISSKLSGRKLSPEHKQKIGDSLRGRKFTDEHRSKISKACMGRPNKRKGIPLSIETRRKLSENAKTNPNYGMKGKHLSLEARKKISENNRLRERKYNDDFIQKVQLLRRNGLTCKELAEMFNINYSVMNRLLNHGTSHPRE